MPAYHSNFLALALPLLSLTIAAPQAASNTAITCVEDGGTLYVLGGYTMTVAPGVVCSDGQQVWPDEATATASAAASPTDAGSDSSDSDGSEVNNSQTTVDSPLPTTLTSETVTETLTSTESETVTLTATITAYITSAQTASDPANGCICTSQDTTAASSSLVALTTLGIAPGNASSSGAQTTALTSVVVANPSETYTTAIPVNATQTQSTSARTSTVAATTTPSVFSGAGRDAVLGNAVGAVGLLAALVLGFATL